MICSRVARRWTVADLSPVETLVDPDTCERIVHAALAAGDIRSVEAALTVLAPQDPHRAQELIDAMQMGLILAATATEEETHDG